jgi:hypothetical protein
MKYLLQVLIDHGHRPQVDNQDYGSTKEASYDLEYFSFMEAISSLQLFSNQALNLQVQYINPS